MGPFVASLLMGFAPLPSLAAAAGGPEPMTSPAPACACASAPGDEFDVPLAFAFGRYKGRCVDSCRFRAAKILPMQSYKSLEAGSHGVLVANVQHMEKHFVALIRPRDFHRASVGFEEFFPGVYHVFLKFELREGAPAVRMASQVTGERAVVQTRSLVVSSEGVPPKGRKYNLLDGYLERYALAHRLTTAEESERWIKGQGHSARFYNLNLPPDRVPPVLEAAVRESARAQLHSVYRLFRNNCSTSALEFIAAGFESGALPSSGSSWLQIGRAIPIVGPLSTLGFLDRVNLISPLPKSPAH